MEDLKLVAAPAAIETPEQFANAGIDFLQSAFHASGPQMPPDCTLKIDMSDNLHDGQGTITIYCKLKESPSRPAAE